jgi:hypothetical protein
MILVISVSVLVGLVVARLTVKTARVTRKAYYGTAAEVIPVGMYFRSK